MKNLSITGLIDTTFYTFMFHSAMMQLVAMVIKAVTQ